MIVVWSVPAIRDLQSLRDYIREFNPTAASELGRKITEAVDRLPDFPGIGRPGRKPHTRELVISGTPYFVPYRVTGNRIEIVAVIHGARKWPE